MATLSPAAPAPSTTTSADVTDDAGVYQSKYSKPLTFRTGASYSSALPDSKDLTGTYKEYKADYATPSKWSSFAATTTTPRAQQEVRDIPLTQMPRCAR